MKWGRLLALRRLCLLFPSAPPLGFGWLRGWGLFGRPDFRVLADHLADAGAGASEPQLVVRTICGQESRV